MHAERVAQLPDALIVEIKEEILIFTFLQILQATYLAQFCQKEANCLLDIRQLLTDMALFSMKVVMDIT
jgi:hypothetical protein